MATPTGDDADTELGWGVGSVAARLGIAASTLRTWERRYDVGPSRRTVGGHRRYTEADISRVMLTQLLISRGAPPSDAARVAHSLDEGRLADALDSEQGLPGPDGLSADEAASAVIEAATSDDQRRIGLLVNDALRDRGVVAAWTEVIAPSLITIGQEWSAGRLTLEAEHLASDAIAVELRSFTRRRSLDEAGRATIVLASAEDDLHSLPLFALEAALAEAGMSAYVLGARVPAKSLAELAERLHPRVVFLWASISRSDEEPIRAVLADLDERTTVILGGPGWPHEMALQMGRGSTMESADLPTTVARILDLVRDARPYPPVT